jgi:glutamate 5-kinase
MGKRVIVKFGTGILTTPDGANLDLAQFERFAAELSAARHAGHEVILVSSGAIATGMSELGLAERPVDLPMLQACAAIGQSRLMELYRSLFAKHGLLVAQLLLTSQDLDSRIRYTNARNTLNAILKLGRVIPIINENDSVATDEVPRFADNDVLSAEVAILSGADQLIILSGINGLTENPDGSGAAIPLVKDISEVERFVGETKGRLSRGGMRSKLSSVRKAVEQGIRATIANGRTPGMIAGALAEEQVGTTFLPSRKEAPGFPPL